MCLQHWSWGQLLKGKILLQERKTVRQESKSCRFNSAFHPSLPWLALNCPSPSCYSSQNSSLKASPPSYRGTERLRGLRVRPDV